MAFKGGNIEQMRDLQKKLDDAAKNTIPTSLSAIERKISNPEIWKGRDAENFRGQTMGQVKTQLNEAKDILAKAANDLKVDIDEQVATSKA